MASDQPLRLEDDGTITLTVAQRRYRLRRPQMLELRNLWEGWDRARDDTDEALDPHRDTLTELREQRVDQDLPAEERRTARKAYRELNAKLTVENQAVWAVWIREVFATLATPGLPDPDGDDPAEGLEPWMVTPAIGADFLAHWQAVPLGRGDGRAGIPPG